MATRTRFLMGAVLGGLFASVACSSSSSDDGPGSSGGTTGGSPSSGGQGGTSSARGGSAGKPSTGGKTGAGGSAGVTVSEGGAGGEAGAAPVCPGCASGFCLADGSCVDCLPSNDHCPAAQYCTDANTCAAGCKSDGSNCASGVCTANHDCKSCIGDQECSAGHLCGAGQCAPACSATETGTSADCSADLICCSSHCTDLKTDSHHCGACGTACGDSQFCGITACSDTGAGGAGDGGAGGAGNAGPDACVACQGTTLSNVCSIRSVIVISDADKNMSDGNLAPARAMAAALHDECASAPTVSEERQDTTQALNITTGQPVSASDTLLLVAGGPFYQNLEGYFEKSVSPVYWEFENNVTLEYRARSTGNIVVSMPFADPHDSHDYFVIQFMRDPASGSLVLNIQGFWLEGTTAAAYYFEHGFLQTRDVLSKAWYAYEWQDQNGDKLPDLNEITLVSSGS